MCAIYKDPGGGCGGGGGRPGGGAIWTPVQVEKSSGLPPPPLPPRTQVRAALVSAGASGNAWPSPGRCCGSPSCCCWTRPMLRAGESDRGGVGWLRAQGWWRTVISPTVIQGNPLFTWGEESLGGPFWSFPTACSGHQPGKSLLRMVVRNSLLAPPFSKCMTAESNPPTFQLPQTTPEVETHGDGGMRPWLQPYRLLNPHSRGLLGGAGFGPATVGCNPLISMGRLPGVAVTGVFAVRVSGRGGVLEESWGLGRLGSGGGLGQHRAQRSLLEEHAWST